MFSTGLGHGAHLYHLHTGSMMQPAPNLPQPSSPTFSTLSLNGAA